MLSLRNAVDWPRCALIKRWKKSVIVVINGSLLKIYSRKPTAHLYTFNTFVHHPLCHIPAFISNKQP